MNTTIKEEEGKVIALFSGRFDTLPPLLLFLLDLNQRPSD